MKMTDGKRTIEITIRTWDEECQQYGEDWAAEWFCDAKFDRERGLYIVDDVEYCIEQADDSSDEDCPAHDENVSIEVFDLTPYVEEPDHE